MAKLILMFFSVVFCSLLGTVLPQTRPIQLRCSAWLVQNETTVSCVSRGNEELVVSMDFLRQLNVSGDVATYLLSEYPQPIRSFSIDKPGGIMIKENALKALPQLTSLTLWTSRGTITVPRDELKNTPGLKRLNIRDGTIPASTLQAIRSAPKLERLEIRNTKGGKLKYYDSLHGLVKVNTNGFDTIEQDTFDGLTELEDLILDGNSIRSITTTLPKDSGNLTTIDLYNNAICTIPKSAFANYRQLGMLILSNNPITKLETGVFEGLENLVILSLSACPIHQLPESDLQNMKNLEDLSLYGTMISKINSTTFKGLRKLTQLGLGECKVLETIEPGSFDDLVSVTSLDLRGNPNLKELPDGLFKNTKMLRSVNLEGTCVQNLSRANFTHCPNFRTLVLGTCTAAN